MNMKYFWISVLAGGVLTTLVSNLPWVGLVNIFCFAGFWGSAIFTTWLYRRLTGALTFRQAFLVGLLSGVCAGLLGFGLSFAGLAGLQGLVNGLARLLPAEEITAASLTDAIPFNLCGVITNIACGGIGGLIGGALFRTDRQGKQASSQMVEPGRE